MSNKKQTQNDEILAIRMPQKLLVQLNALAQAKGVGTSTMARMALIDYLKDEAPDALIGTVPNTTQTNGRKLSAYEISEIKKKQAMSPAQRRAYEEEWANDDWA